MFGLFALGFALQATVGAPCESLTASQVREDLVFFRDSYGARERAFSPAARRRLHALVDSILAHPQPMSRARLALVFAEGQAYSGNNHTQNDLFDEECDFHVLPIAFWWFSEGAIVTRAHPEYRHLIGSRIVAIGGVPVGEAARRVSRFISGTAWRKRYESPNWPRRLEVLQTLGLADSSGATFEFVQPSGTRIRSHLPISPSRDPAVLTPTWRESIVPGKGSPPWPQATDGLLALPAYLQTPADLSYHLLASGRVLYLRSNDLYDYDDRNPIQAKAYAMMDSLATRPRWPTHVIVDLRFNDGGDFLKILALAEELTRMTAPAGRIYVITGRATNSAAIIFTALLKSHAVGRTTIVGEPMSDREHFWSEGGYLKAPASGLAIRYTDGYHDWANGCTDRSRCYWAAMLHGERAGSLSPDILIAQSYADYAAGRDPDLDAVLADLTRHDRAVRAALGRHP